MGTGIVPGAPVGGRWSRAIVRLIVRVVWTSTLVLVPLFGFWLASSLAAFDNASQWIALAVGLALFPIVPVAWELIYTYRRRGSTKLPILTRLDRLILRTLIVNGVFLGGMLWRAPDTAFRALSVRGDWMLDGRDDETSNQIRGVLLGLADKFDKLWHPRDAQYGKSDAAPDPSERKPTPTPVPTPTPTPGSGAAEPTPPTPPAPPPATWPLPPAPDPAVNEMPAEAQASIDAVGKYLAQHFPDPRLRVKAIHDFVALRLTYDDATLAKILAHDHTDLPSQQAEDVFASRVAVCEGYARLMVALGKAADVDIAFVTGHIRDITRRAPAEGSDEEIKAALEGYSHAWNAAKIDGQWLLVDATWDDPKDSKEPLRSTYLFTPPAAFARDHLPDDPAWQLLPTPLSAGEFARQPMLTPEAEQLGLTLLDPWRSQVDARGSIELVFDNPRHAKLLGSVRDGNTRDRDACTIEDRDGNRPRIRCTLPRGQVEVWIFAAPADDTSGVLDGIGAILVNSR